MLMRWVRSKLCKTKVWWCVLVCLTVCSWSFKISRRVERGWKGALDFCEMNTEHIMKSYTSKRFEEQSTSENDIEAATYQPEFSITVPGCTALLLRLCLVSKYQGDSQDIPFNMRRSASLLQGMVDMVCSRKRLVWQLERCGFSLTVDDSMVDLGSFVAAQIGAKLKNAQDVRLVHQPHPFA